MAHNDRTTCASCASYTPRTDKYGQCAATGDLCAAKCDKYCKTYKPRPQQ